LVSKKENALSSAWFETPLDRGWIPDVVIRAGIRRFCAQRLRAEREAGAAGKIRFIEQMRSHPIALETGAANRQHYEVPSTFFQLVLGPRLKYSACYWPDGTTKLAAAEEATLEQAAQRARLADGQRILELGCGWGSLSLYMAERFPAASITAVSNSSSQKAFIDGEARRRGFTNLTTVTADMNRFTTKNGLFDRVVSIEMFEHMRNWDALLARIARWTAPGGLLFVHVFSHSSFTYPFEVGERADWMAQHFFTGGLMPSDDLLLHFADHWHLARHWTLSGDHYRRTAEAWLANLDRCKVEAAREFSRVYTEDEAQRWVRRWRVFFMACAELFGYRGGSEWQVSQYLLEKA
jgi:cyclopropane-fatty-acyl-phospholipid synthase